LVNKELLNDYSFWDLWDPAVFVVMVIIAMLYFLLSGPLRHLIADSEVVPTRTKLTFYSGLATLYVAQGTPLHIIGHDYLFSAHMLEQSLVYMVAPPLIMLGLPGWLLNPLWNIRMVRNVKKFSLHPFVAMLSFNALFSLYHIPSIFDAVNANGGMHTLVHSVLLVAAFQMWQMIVGIERHRLSELRKMGFIVANGILLYPACGLIIFADKPLYMTYHEAPELISLLNALSDQQLGGVIMKLVQEGVFIVALAFLFFQWYRRENKEQYVDSEFLAKARGL
jgi:putative membrane protein